MTNAVLAPSTVEVDYDPFAGGELECVVPTTEPQREVWLASQLATEASLAYNESVSLRLRGRLDAEALHASLQSLVSMHDALRTAFSPDGETFCVLEDAHVPLVGGDLSSLGEEQRKQAVDARLRHSVEAPFALEQGPLFRTELLRLAADEHLLILSAHHIVCDGWSWWVIVRELGQLYAQRTGHASPALPVPAQYSDYALHENRRSGSAEEAADEAYWLSRFHDEAPALDLPTDRPRPGRRGFASRREDYMLDAELVASLRRLGARRGASLFATLLAGFGAVLSRITGQQDVVIGIPAAGQSVDGHDSLVGHCVNLLPLRFDLAPTTPFGDVLDQAKDVLLDAIEHQRYTFGTLLKKIKVARDPSRLPLVSVMFNIDQALDQEREVFPGLALEFTTNPRSYENFELSINAVQCSGQLRLECQYNSGLFEASTVRRWLAAYEALLRGTVQQVDAPVSRLGLVDVAARLDLCALQPAPEPFERELLMHEGFERTCDRDPGRVAAVFGGEQWSYAQLESRANRIAHLLRARGVGRGDLVGLAVDRGLDMLASLLGILKSGAGYVPLDPQFPPERIAYMAEDAGLAALVTQASHAGRFAQGPVQVLALDALAEALQAAPDGRVGRDTGAATAESTAYVIYTSGSTGRPKGVQVPHRAVSNFIAAMRQEPGLRAEDTLVAVTTLSFDIAVLELMLPLSVGARLVIASRDTIMDGAAFVNLIEASRATVLQATPALWRLLLDAGWSGGADFSALCGGEPLPHDLAAQLLERCGKLWNLYGPTETTVWSTCARILPPAQGATPDIHIGRPILNTQVWILDEHGELCPRGVPGEICIGGDGVTLGYLHRPELTAEKFIPDRFRAMVDPAASPQDNLPQPATLYRTGDRGRWRNDGNLEHLGRLDFQVKVRGYRIELGEIESNLSSHAQVSRNIVVAREDRPGDVRLVAYVVLEPGAGVDEAALLSHLRASLPEYMVPQHVIVLDTLPLLPNGKIDRKSLPAPEIGTHRAQALVAPRTPLERKVADIMAATLGLAEIGIHDNFFAMGGHSLLAAQLTSRLNRELQVSLSLRALFDGPTVERLALIVGQNQADPTAAPRAPIVHRADQRTAPLSLIQERLKLLEDFNPGQLTYNTPSAHWLNGELDVGTFDRAFQEVMRRQPVLRTTIGDREGEGVQVVHDTLPTGLGEVEDLTHLPPEQREPFLMQRLKTLIETPFELFDSPLFRARLFKVDEQRHALLFMTHHIIWDGWSFDLFYKAIAEIYGAYLEGREPDLPELTVTYGDFSVWHREWVKSDEYARQLAFWRDRLGAAGDSGNGGALDLSGGKPRKPSFSGRGMSQSFGVDRATADALRKVGLSMDATLFVVLLTAYLALLNRVTGQKDMIVATPVRGRNSAEVEELMGYFTNLLPLRAQIDPERPFAEAVARVKEVMLDSFANPDIRLEEVARELSLRGSRRMSGLYQTLFSLQDIRQRVTRWGNLQHERLEVFQPGATEDLGLWLLESDHGLAAGLVYNAEILLDEDVAVLRRNYESILRQIVSDPTRTLGALTEFAQGDRLQIRSLPAAARDAAGSAAPKPERAPSAATAGPATALERRVGEAMGEVLGLDAFGPEDDFFELGGHSMVAVQLFQRLRRHTGVNLPLGKLLAAPTPRALAAEYRQAGAEDDSPEGAGAARPATDPWAPLVLLQEGSGASPLFLIHAVGGNVLNYRALARKLPATLTVYGLQALGLDGKTPPLATVEAMAQRYESEIRRAQPQGPYRIAGGSMGGIIAYEIARRLVSSGEEVSFLGLFDTSSGRREGTGGDTGVGARMIDYLRQRSPQRLWLGLVSRLRRVGLGVRVRIARAIGAELPHEIRYAEVHRVHYRASCRYVVRPYDGDIVVYRAEDQQGRFPDSPTLGWSGLVRHVQVIDIPGNHDDLVEAPELAKALALGLSSPHTTA
jgi:amino acid adenylation domain-containing protein